MKNREKNFGKENKKEKKPVKLRDYSSWVSECDERLSAEFCTVTEEICSDESVKLIRLVGPTCSGKTTAANMLKERFLARGKYLHIVSIDDFYYDTDKLREISSSLGLDNVDYDSPDTIDIDALRSFVNEIFTKDVSHCPIFDFNIGKRSGSREFKCGEEDIFLFEGIQALYPNVSELFANIGHPSVEIYIAPQSAIEVGGSVFDPCEIRLMRRIVRDRNFRRTEAEFTFHLWRSVRQNEEKYIFPFIKDCKYSIDSTMPYEIGILKPYLKKAFSVLPQDSEYRSEADVILKKIERVPTLSDALIKDGSLYREFV